MALQASRCIANAACYARDLAGVAAKAQEKYFASQVRLQEASVADQQAYTAMIEAHDAYRTVCRRNTPLIESLLGDGEESEYCAQLVAEVNAARELYNTASRRFAGAVNNKKECQKQVDNRLRAWERADDRYHKAVETMWKHAATAQKEVGSGNCIAEQAGVPREHFDAVQIVPALSGNVNVYFGGLGRPDGFEHGHSVIGVSGNVVYFREPGAPHGSHNFI